MADYNFRAIEQKWQKKWVEQQTYKVVEDPSKKKFYVLNMFPYPSGAGLHVGHPLGYIASDIYARYKRQQGYNVLNPMGYDAYGLPAEQYAIQTGQHPEKTTFQNIDRYREQLDKIGFSFDWDREVRTCTPDYYHWTQWAFELMFESYYDTALQKAQPITKLVEHLAQHGTEGLNAWGTEELSISSDEWNAMDEKAKSDTLMNWRIAFLGETMVNWCPELGTVLANDEVVDQRNWIGRSEGAEIVFKVADSDKEFTIFTTRADTMFGVTFMVLAPESELVGELTTAGQQKEVEAYLEQVKSRTERERMIDKKVTGVFTGSYAINPFTGEKNPIWVSDYVLAGYGTGAIMAVPAHDSRDYAFARHFDLPIIPLVEGADVSEESYDAKEGIVMNSPRAGVKPYIDFSLNGMTVKEAIEATKKYVNPVYYKHGIPQMIPAECLPLELPEVDKFLPTETGEPPLGNATRWAWDEAKREVVDNSLIDEKTVFPIVTRCLALPVHQPITCAIWILTTTRRWWERQPMNTGRTWTSMWAERSMPPAT